jgi:hypothetical protein
VTGVSRDSRQTIRAAADTYGAISAVVAHELLDALDEAERRAQKVRDMCAEARPGVTLRPADCTDACGDGDCDCSGLWRTRAWNLDPAAVLRALDGETPARIAGICSECGAAQCQCGEGTT